ncbi:MAG: hypothetical protein U5R48_00785 [Gammaproteobacteria bacterium]|nr:hypothetical protein [Gammaproteobacteria bacterium]
MLLLATAWRTRLVEQEITNLHDAEKVRSEHFLERGALRRDPRLGDRPGCGMADRLQRWHRLNPDTAGTPAGRSSRVNGRSGDLQLRGSSALRNIVRVTTRAVSRARWLRRWPSNRPPAEPVACVQTPPSIWTMMEAFTEGDMVDGNIVGGLRFDDAVPTDSAFIGSKRFTQLSDRTISIQETNTGDGSKSVACHGGNWNETQDLDAALCVSAWWSWRLRVRLSPRMRCSTRRKSQGAGELLEDGAGVASSVGADALEDLVRGGGVIGTVDFDGPTVTINGLRYDFTLDARVEIGGSFGAPTLLTPGLPGPLRVSSRRHACRIDHRSVQELAPDDASFQPH